MRNSVKGGASYFVDAFRAAQMLRLSNLMGFNALTSTPVSFHYVNDNRHYYYSRPTIVLGKHPKLPIDHINYAPPFQAPFDLDSYGKDRANWKRFCHAFKEFSAILETPEMKYEETMKPGDGVVFANRRVLHARRAFDTSAGERWLKGTYVDWDDFQVYSFLRPLTS
jgi:gamma-butyrobetaine dioxygenase